MSESIVGVVYYMYTIDGHDYNGYDCIYTRVETKKQMAALVEQLKERTGASSVSVTRIIYRRDDYKQ